MSFVSQAQRSMRCPRDLATPLPAARGEVGLRSNPGEGLGHNSQRDG